MSRGLQIHNHHACLSLQCAQRRPMQSSNFVAGTEKVLQSHLLGGLREYNLRHCQVWTSNPILTELVSHLHSSLEGKPFLF